MAKPETTLPQWARDEVNAIGVCVQRERERRAILDEFHGNPHSMAAEIWRLRRELENRG